MLFLSLKIADIRIETSDTKTFCFKQPGLKKIKYLPGQYLTLVFRINARKYSRPYSFSSAPGIDEHLEVTVKRVPGGVVSNHMNDFLSVGDIVEAMPPMGDFIFNPDIIKKETHIVLWGAGSGITPLISITKYVLFKETGNKVTLIYGNRNSESIIFGDKIEELKKIFQHNFKAWHFHSKLKVSEENPDIIEGRIDPRRVLSAMKELTDLPNTRHYICGPSGLKESVKKTLRDLQIDENKIFSEDFENVKNPSDFEGISTQMVEIWKNGKMDVAEIVKGRSILEGGLDALIDLDYSCQTGSCLICKARILSGEVKMIGLSKKPEGLLADECLLCCSYPLTKDVKVVT